MPTDLPYDADAERYVLGAVLLDNRALESAANSGIRTLDFFQSAARDTWDAMLALDKASAKIDAVTLDAELRSRQSSVSSEFLNELMWGLPRVVNVSEWCGLILQTSIKRQLARAGNELAKTALDPATANDETIAQTQADLDAISKRATRDVWRDDKADADAVIASAELRMKEPDGILGLRTGIVSLDKKLQGIRPTQLVLVGGRLKSGKSALAMQIAANVADTEEGAVAFFSLEMSGEGLMRRRIAGEAGVNLNTLHTASPQDLDDRWNNVLRAYGRVLDSNLMVSTSTYSVDAMRAAVRQLQWTRPVSLVVVDYVQKVRPRVNRMKRNEEVAEIARDLKALAMDLNVPVLAAAQLNRNQEGKQDHRPTTADLAESDVLGRECDVAILIHREPRPPKGEDPRSTRGLADLIIAANRDGMAGTTRVQFRGFMQRFVDLEAGQ